MIKFTVKKILNFIKRKKANIDAKSNIAIMLIL